MESVLGQGLSCKFAFDKKAFKMFIGWTQNDELQMLSKANVKFIFF